MVSPLICFQNDQAVESAIKVYWKHNAYTYDNIRHIFVLSITLSKEMSLKENLFHNFQVLRNKTDI